MITCDASCLIDNLIAFDVLRRDGMNTAVIRKILLASIKWANVLYDETTLKRDFS